MNGLNRLTLDPLIVLDIGGVRFRTYSSTLRTFPNTLLANLTEESPHYKKELGCYFFDRNPTIFHFVLDIYRTGKLHLTNQLCYDSFQEELLYWDLDLKAVLAPCCAGTWQEYEEKKMVLDKVYKTALDETSRTEATKAMIESSQGWELRRYKLWMFLNWPDYGKWSMAWAILQIALIFLSILVYALMTCEEFVDIYPTPPGYNLTGLARHESPISVEFPHTWLRLADVVINTFFTIEFLIRIVLAPDRKRHMRSVYTIGETLGILMYWVFAGFAYRAYLMGYYTQTVAAFLNSIIILQILRLMKGGKLATSFVQVRSILLSIRNSLTEIFVIVLSIMTFMFFFSVIVYYTEMNVGRSSYPNLPTAFYWAVITMTSVGYGDVVPSTPGGYVTAALCSITGIFLTGLAVSILAHNLSVYTQLTTQQERAQKLMNERVVAARRHHAIKRRNRIRKVTCNGKRITRNESDGNKSPDRGEESGTYDNKTMDESETATGESIECITVQPGTESPDACTEDPTERTEPC